MNAKLASVECHANELIQSTEIFKRAIDIKKRFAYKKGFRSKVLAAYAIEDDAEDIDEAL